MTPGANLSIRWFGWGTSPISTTYYRAFYATRLSSLGTAHWPRRCTEAFGWTRRGHRNATQKSGATETRGYGTPRGYYYRRDG